MLGLLAAMIRRMFTRKIRQEAPPRTYIVLSAKISGILEHNYVWNYAAQEEEEVHNKPSERKSPGCPVVGLQLSIGHTQYSVLSTEIILRLTVLGEKRTQTQLSSKTRSRSPGYRVA